MESDNKHKNKIESLIDIGIHNVSKAFSSETGVKIQALDNVSFNVMRSEFVTLVGATGCGKTTLLNLISGLDIPDRGYLHLHQDLRLGDNVAYVFQHYTLFPWRSTLGNITFGLQMRGTPRKQRKSKAHQLLSNIGLVGFEYAYPHELSGGMRQRAAIAQALAIQPRLLIMDEPFGAVDDSTRSELQQMLISLWQDTKTTILFVTHNIDEAIVLGERVLVFSERPGKIMRELKVDLPRPRNRMSKEFTDLFIQIRRLLSGQLD